MESVIQPLPNKLNPYYKAFKRKQARPICPTKEEYYTYQEPEKEFRKMTIKEMTYHNWMHNYWIINIKPVINYILDGGKRVP